jgi:hypothetical protein
MIEYWEALGRLAYEKELFDEFKRALGPPVEVPWITVSVGKYPCSGFDIAEAEYKKAQRFLAPILTEGFLSLMAAGELIWMFSTESVRAAFDHVNGIVSGTGPALYGPSTSYFIALGLIIVDPRFREKLQDSYEGCFFTLPRLSDRERDQIKALLRDTDFPDALGPIEFLWTKACNDQCVANPFFLLPAGMSRSPTVSPTPPTWSTTPSTK